MRIQDIPQSVVKRLKLHLTRCYTPDYPPMLNRYRTCKGFTPERRQKRKQLPNRSHGELVNLLEDVFHPGASEVVGDRVHLVQSGLDDTAAQEVFRVHLVEVKGQFSKATPLWLTEAREDLKRTNKTWMIQMLISGPSKHQ